jgi:hypothetical protein
MASPLVVPVDRGRFTAGRPVDDASQRIGRILLHTNRYALTTWYRTVKDFDAQAARYLDFGGVVERHVRPSASEALALAVSLATDLYDPAVVGLPATTARATATKLVRSLAYRHKINLRGGWGGVWQSGLWAAYTGVAGWLLWDDPGLASNDRQNVRQLVEYEANRYIGYRVPYYRDPGGTVVSPGDSNAEENAWVAMLLRTAAAMMPDHAHHAAWTSKGCELLVSAFARPADVTDPTVVNGRSVAHWLHGSNVNPDGVVVNHGRLHPDYMTTFTQNAFSALVDPLAGRPTPRAALWNGDVVYRALVDLPFTAGRPYPPGGAIVAPGGTIYRPGSGDIYYPQGNDWGTRRRMHFALADIQAGVLGLDIGASQRGRVWEPLHAQVVLDMQLRHADRRTYAATGEDTYAGREEWVAAHAAQAWLTKWLAHHDAITIVDDPVPIVVDNLDREFRVVSGHWRTTSPPDRLGPHVRYTAAAAPAGSGEAGARVRWTPRISVAGDYRIAAWWTAYPNHATDAPYTIRHPGGPTTVRTDQKVDGGRWNDLGTYRLDPRTPVHVDLTNDANAYVTADAVRLDLVAAP